MGVELRSGEAGSKGVELKSGGSIRVVELRCWHSSDGVELRNG